MSTRTTPACIAMPLNDVRAPRASDDIGLGIKLSAMYGRRVSPVRIDRVLRRAGVSYVIIGTHAANAYSGRPRATADVDLIVRLVRKAANAIAEAFPRLIKNTTDYGFRFRDQRLEAIDLFKAGSSPLFAHVLTNATTVRVERSSLRIPSLEAQLVLRYNGMRRHGGGHTLRMYEIADFIRIAEANMQIDMAVLQRLGDLIDPGGGREILKLVADARAGKRLNI